MTDTIINTRKVSPVIDLSVALDATSLRRWQRACPLKASLTLKMPPRAQSINVAHLKTLAEIVAQPEQDRYELHDQIDARVSSIDKRLEYLIRHGLVQKTGPKGGITIAMNTWEPIPASFWSVPGRRIMPSRI